MARASRLRSTSAFSYLDGRTRHRDAPIGAQLDGRTHLNGRLHAGGAAVVLLENLELGPIDRVEIVLADHLCVDLGEDVLDGLSRDGLTTVGLLENFPRYLTHPEAGQPNVLHELSKGTILGRGKLRAGDRKFERHLGGGEPS